MTLTVPCLFGLEGLVSDEMKRLKLNNVRAENGRVHCEGSMLDIARLNLNLRCGARVLMELGSFPVPDFEALFQGVLALPWEDYIPRDGEFPVKGYSLTSVLHSVPACQAIVKKAAAKRLGRSNLPLLKTSLPCIWIPPAMGCTNEATGQKIWGRPCGRRWLRLW